MADGDTVSTNSLIALIAANLDKRIVQLPVPTLLMRLAAITVGKSQLSAQLLGDLEIDATKARRLLSWSARYDIREAIANCYFSKRLN